MISHTALGNVGVDATGEGAPLVLLHGFPHDRSLWAPQLAAAPAGVRVIAPDLPGFGESASLADASFDSWADGLAGLLDALRMERAIVGGLSMGGYLAFAVADRMITGMVGRATRETRPAVVATR